jgi:hypothetical protein
MFRFTIRELLLLTVIVAMGVGWWIDRSNLAVQAKQAETWRHCTGALEYALRYNDWSVKWSGDRSEVEVLTGEGWRGGLNLRAQEHEPGATDVELAPIPRF